MTSQGNLAAVELRRLDHHQRDADGARVSTAAVIDEENVIDYTDGHCVGPEVTIDGPTLHDMVTKPYGTRIPTRSVPYRTSAPERDNRSEVEILRSKVDGLIEKVARLENCYSHLLNDRYPDGIPFGSRTT